MGDDARAWEDRDAIEQLIYRYTDAVTRADYEQMATVFADDAVWESPILGMHFTSAREFIDFQIEGSASLDVLIQTAANPVIDLVGPDRATATTNIREIIRGTNAGDVVFGGAEGDELNIDQYGIYFDEVVKVDNTWKFARRVFVPILIAPGVAGEMTTARPITRPH